MHPKQPLLLGTLSSLLQLASDAFKASSQIIYHHQYTVCTPCHQDVVQIIGGSDAALYASAVDSEQDPDPAAALSHQERVVYYSYSEQRLQITYSDRRALPATAIFVLTMGADAERMLEVLESFRSSVDACRYPVLLFVDYDRARRDRARKLEAHLPVCTHRVVAAE